METLYLWPDHPFASLFALWAGSVLFLWAARAPMLQLLANLSASLESGFASVGEWCRSTAGGLRQRHREGLRAASELELQSRISREVLRIDASFSNKLEQYASLHRKTDDLIQALESDYSACGDSPPKVPGWTGAAK